MKFFNYLPCSYSHQLEGVASYRKVKWHKCLAKTSISLWDPATKDQRLTGLHGPTGWSASWIFSKLQVLAISVIEWPRGLTLKSLYLALLWYWVQIRPHRVTQVFLVVDCQVVYHRYSGSPTFQTGSSWNEWNYLEGLYNPKPKDWKILAEKGENSTSLSPLFKLLSIPNWLCNIPLPSSHLLTASFMPSNG